MGTILVSFYVGKMINFAHFQVQKAVLSCKKLKCYERKKKNQIATKINEFATQKDNKITNTIQKGKEKG